MDICLFFIVTEYPQISSKIYYKEDLDPVAHVKKWSEG